MDLVTKITDNKHFDQNLETRVVSQASKFGLGAALRTLDFIFICIKILNNYEENYSRNTLEWLRVVSAAEYFNFFIYMSNNLRSSLITKHSWERWVHQRKPKCIRKLPKNGTKTGRNPDRNWMAGNKRRWNSDRTNHRPNAYRTSNICI